MSQLDAENLRAHGERVLGVFLPCGHGVEVSYDSLRAMDELACLGAKCGECGCEILGEELRRQVLILLERAERERFTWDEVYSGFGAVLVGKEALIRVSARRVREVLVEPLQGLRVPESVMPGALWPGEVLETKIVLHALGRDLHSNDGEVLTVTWRGLVERLRGRGLLALEEWNAGGRVELPPGFLGFLEKWFSRAVGCLYEDSRAVVESDVAVVSERLAKACVD